MLVTKSNPVRGRVGKRHQGKASKRRGHRVRRQRQKKVKGEEEEEESERNQEARGKTTERQRQEDGSVEKEEKRKEQRVRAVLDQGGVPTKVAVGRDRNEAGVLLLLAPCLVGPVVQVCQVGRALCTELHPGRACKDSPVSTQGRREAHPSDQTPLGGHTGKPRPSSSAPPPPSPEPKASRVLQTWHHTHRVAAQPVAACRDRNGSDEVWAAVLEHAGPGPAVHVGTHANM